MKKKKIKKIKNKNKKPEKSVSKRFIKQSNFKSAEEKVAQYIHDNRFKSADVILPSEPVACS